jgi:hypothetical protein
VTKLIKRIHLIFYASVTFLAAAQRMAEAVAGQPQEKKDTEQTATNDAPNQTFIQLSTINLKNWQIKHE